MLQIIGRLNVPVPGTPVRATSTFADPTANFKCHGFMFQADPDNTGRVYIGEAGMDKSTLAGVAAVLATPTTNLVPSFSCALTWSPNGLNLEQLYIDTDNADNGALLTVLIA